jgi:pimeloyl-ACP methyl ester carboxylesterase
MDRIETRYARSGDVNIAYQIVGDGPLDLVFVSGWVSNLDLMWAEPSYARFLRRLASFSRLILFDKRGTGLSDRVPDADLPTLEARMDDVRAVLDAAGAERAALLGHSEGGPMCLLFAATYPERTIALALIGTYARRLIADDYPFGAAPEAYEAFLREIADGWGGPVGLEVRAPSLVDDERFRTWWADYLRMSASPGAALALTRMNGQIDVRPVLGAIGVPTLVVHRTGDRSLPVEGARFLAERIRGARLVELPGEDHLPFVGDPDEILDEIEEFLTGIRPLREPDRVLATVLFTDIVGSTTRAAELGDRRWRDLLEAHHSLVRRQLERWRGREVDTAGDGFLATFDGPARAIRCACAIRDTVAGLDLEIRAGLHCGEVELVGDDVAGIAVHTGARVAALARANEVLVSSTVRDLVAGSDIGFEERGEHELKGVPGSWRLYAVLDA